MSGLAGWLPEGVGILDLFFCALAGFLASIIGGLAGYGSGLLMPLFLVPVLGPEPVIPVIGVMAIFTNGGRITAFRDSLDWQKAWRLMVAAMPFTVLGAWFYAWLSGRGVLVLIGLALLVAVPLRRWLKARAWQLGENGLVAGGILYGTLAGGTNTSGVLLISLLTATGIAPLAVIATDAVVSFVIGLVKTAAFAGFGALTPGLVVFAVMLGCATFPGGYAARFLADRLSLKVHALLLDGAVIVGACVLLWRAWWMG